MYILLVAIIHIQIIDFKFIHGTGSNYSHQYPTQQDLCGADVDSTSCWNRANQIPVSKPAFCAKYIHKVVFHGYLKLLSK